MILLIPLFGAAGAILASSWVIPRLHWQRSDTIYWMLFFIGWAVVGGGINELCHRGISRCSAIARYPSGMCMFSLQALFLYNALLWTEEWPSNTWGQVIWGSVYVLAVMAWLGGLIAYYVHDRIPYHTNTRILVNDEAFVHRFLSVGVTAVIFLIVYFEFVQPLHIVLLVSTIAVIFWTASMLPNLRYDFGILHEQRIIRRGQRQAEKERQRQIAFENSPEGQQLREEAERERRRKEEEDRRIRLEKAEAERLEQERKLREAEAQRKAEEAERERREREEEYQRKQAEERALFKRRCEGFRIEINALADERAIIEAEEEQLKRSNLPPHIIEEELSRMNMLRQEVLRRLAKLKTHLAETYYE